MLRKRHGQLRSVTAWQVQWGAACTAAPCFWPTRRDAPHDDIECNVCQRCGAPKRRSVYWWCDECERIVWFIQQRDGASMMRIAASGELEPSVKIPGGPASWGRMSTSDIALAGRSTYNSTAHAFFARIDQAMDQLNKEIGADVWTA